MGIVLDVVHVQYLNILLFNKPTFYTPTSFLCFLNMDNFNCKRDIVVCVLANLNETIIPAHTKLTPKVTQNNGNFYFYDFTK